MELVELAERLRQSMGLVQKQDIQAVAPYLSNAKNVLLGGRFRIAILSARLLVRLIALIN